VQYDSSSVCSKESVKSYEATDIIGGVVEDFTSERLRREAPSIL